MIKNDWGKNKMSQLSTQGLDKYSCFMHKSSSSILNANEEHEILNTIFFAHCTYSDFPCLWPKSWGFSKTQIGHYGSDRSWKVHFSQCALGWGCELQKLYFSNLQWILELARFYPKPRNRRFWPNFSKSETDSNPIFNKSSKPIKPETES